VSACCMGPKISGWGDKLWKAIMDKKYKTNSPNILCCEDRNGSPFWKGVCWAAQATRMGFKWKIGDGKKVRFWKNQWFSSCSLTIQFCAVYNIVNEQGKTVAEAWDGVNLKFTFRRTVDSYTMVQCVTEPPQK
jgi:hypothetical protein